ncbi:uncharacterized protein LOC116171488 [Photinus pyralis]|uniref:uncharacterized protein LOC116171488 n=1 Tax=Photinus pyralis TaxID=7054 RepID=UPI0012675F0F|nr:uncharacterized protein LOC116171488 [Photinus pyralis]
MAAKIDGISETVKQDDDEHHRPSENCNEVPPKKVRRKSEPKMIENMKEYLHNDSLEKLTTTTLRYWLKQHQVHCTTREKKDDLMKKK